MRVGVLALQGGFALHAERLREIGCEVIEVRKVAQLTQARALVIPGGESTTLLKLLSPELRQAIIAFAAAENPILATCAGVIILASRVVNPPQESLALLDIEVERNAYGRQVDSFIDAQLSWTARGKELIQALPLADNIITNTSESLISSQFQHHLSQPDLSKPAVSQHEGVFIRAPRILKISKNVEILIECHSEPVLVRQGHILGATFHPELSPNLTVIHKLFINLYSRLQEQI